MKRKSILLALSLCSVLVACSNNNTTSSKSQVSEETIQKALDGKVDLEKEQANNADLKDNNVQADNDSLQITADTLRKFMTDIGDFSPSLARNISEDEILNLYKEAEQISKRTGYWDVKDFFFQELSKKYPEDSLKFPLESIEKLYYWKASDADTIGNKFEYERNLMVEKGNSYDEVWSYTDKEVEDAFHKAYEKDPSLYYDDYVKMALEILKGENKDNRQNSKENEDSSNTGEKDPSEYENLLSFGTDEKDYQALKDALVNYYEFKKEIVDKIPNKDIDLAYTRAQKRLEEVGFGDIGLIFEELGKLYPGASTMYTGK